jgi:uncharacterized protein
MAHPPTLDRLGADALRRTVQTFRDTLALHAGRLNRLNVYPVPDGDTGTNMARTLDAVVAEIEGSGADMTATCQAIAHGSLMGARGNSGVILSQILRGLSGTLSSASEHSAPVVADALGAAASAAYTAVLRPIEGTILTVVRESAEAAQAAAAQGADLAATLRRARDAGRSALERTPEMLPVLKDAGVVDAGGAGFLLFLDAALHVVDGEPLPEVDESDTGPSPEQLEAAAHRHASGEGVDVSELRYEVMYFLELDDDRIGDFKNAWGRIGDSIVVVGGDGLWNCHVHSNDIGACIEAALEVGGRPKQIRVTDLFEEVAEEHAHREAAMTGSPVMVAAGPSAAGLPPVTCAVVAVCLGDGLSEMFGQLGVQGIVSGGQTLNPSTAELLDAVANVNAQQVIVLPNNKNIIPVAEQLDSLTLKTVIVVPTRSMPEALAALVVYDPVASAEDNGAEMRAAAESVDTGEVTQAVRDSASDAGPVRAGDWIGLARGEGIVSVADTVEDAATRLLEHLVSPEREILTILEGADADPRATEAIVGWMSAHRTGVQVEVHTGGQPLYPYLFGAE